MKAADRTGDGDSVKYGQSECFTCVTSTGNLGQDEAELRIRVEWDVTATWSRIAEVAKKFNIGHILLLSFALHLFSIAFPSDGFIFDETYYIPAAKDALNGVASNVEQTPLAKLMVALSIKIFGDYWFAWRIPIVLTGIVSLYVFYLIARRFMSERYALFATAMLSFDVIFFVHSSIFVLDMPCICFGLIGMYLYLRKKYEWSAVALGISFLMYLVGLGFLVAIFVYHIATHLRRAHDVSGAVEPRGRYLKTNLKKAAAFLIILLLVGGGGLWLYDLAYRPAFVTSISIGIGINRVVDQAGNPITTITSTQTVTNVQALTNPIENIEHYWNYFGYMGKVLNFSASEVHPPWDWVLPIGNSLNAPHYYTLAVTANGTAKALIDWRSQITPFVEYFCLPIVGVALFNVARKKDKTKLGLFLLCWISGTYVPFLIDQIRIFPHMTNFNYYILPTIPAFALGIPYFWETLVKHPKARDAIILLQLLLTIVFFLYYFPVALIRT